jgi:eukaryotic-like serine/threonine-protein kinase
MIVGPRTSATLEPGTRLGGYEILSVIGTGGMGEVYAARDIGLDRTIALKVLKDRLASDPDRRRRFEREAKAIAALNHPNVVTIHSIESTGRLQFLTMELVKGQPLNARLGRPMSLDSLLKIAIPLADAVATVHQKGITHRDLKPANVMISDDGRVKVLDFGLAKLRDDADEAIVAGRLSTATDPLTENGDVIGTVAYMSPEQAEGVRADERADIFSLGVILFEMATGQHPFTGVTRAALIASLLRDTPPLATTIRPQLPIEFSRIVRRCLVKDVDHRYQSAKDLRNALEELKQDLDSGRPLVDRTSTTPALALGVPRSWWLGGGLAALGATAVAFVYIENGHLRSNTTTPEPLTFTKLTSQAGIEQHPSFSPDGRWIVYSAPASGTEHIFLHSVGGENPIDLTGDQSSHDVHPAFSPDGEQIAFRSDRLGGGVFVMGRTGEFARRVASKGFNPAWSPDSRKIVYSTEGVETNPYQRDGVGALWTVDIASGTTQRIYEGDAVQPAWSPDGHRIAFWMVADNGHKDLFTIPAAGGAAVAVTTDAAVDFSPAWSPDGRYLLFSSDRSGSPNLWRVPIEESTGRVLGPLEPLTTNSAWVADLTISGDGQRIAYASMINSSNIQRFDLDQVTGEPTGPGTWLTTGSAFRRFIDVSPDGRRLVFSSGIGQEDIFVSDADGTKIQQLTNDTARDRRPTWSPDGRQIAFESTRSGPYQMWIINGDGSNSRLLTDDPTFRFIYHAWSPSGDRMFTISNDTWKGLIFDPRVPWKDQRPEVLPSPPFIQFAALSWSPDGRRLAGWGPEGIATYDHQTRTYEMLTRDRGFLPMWLGSHRLLYPLGSSLMLLDLSTKSPREILSVAPDVIRNLAVSRDGRQLFINRGANEGDIWMAQIK